MRGVSLAVAPGEVVALVGPNGCGKSTLARVLAGSLVVQRGSVLVDGMPLAAAQDCSAVGYVRQDPKSQLVAPVVLDEVAFGPCNLGLSSDEVCARVHEALGRVGLSGYENRLTETLSGGEQQRLALAGVLAMRPRYLVLDEVTSMLDGVAREQVRRLVRDLANSGIGVLLVTHCADDVLVADRVLAMNDGGIVWEGKPKEAVIRRELGVRDAEHLADGAGGVAESGASAMMDMAAPAPASQSACAYSGPSVGSDACEVAASSSVCLIARDINIACDNKKLLSDVSLEVATGEVLLVAGPSGSGKTTLARVLTGVLKPDGGEVRIEGTEGSIEPVRPGVVGLCLQRPEEQFLRATVLDDVAFAPESRGMSQDGARRIARDILTRLGVSQGLWESSVYALSGGETRLVAIAGVMAQDEPVVVFDEPTAGLDGDAAKRVCSAIRELADEGRAVVVVSHELEEWLPIADGAALLSKGELIWSGPASELLSEAVGPANGLSNSCRGGRLSERSGAFPGNPPAISSDSHTNDVASGFNGGLACELATSESPLSKAGLLAPSPWRINPSIWRGGRP